MTDGQPEGPVATAAATLSDWLSALEVPARWAVPGSGDGAVCLWPLALQSEQAIRDQVGRVTLRLRVRYLLAVDPADAGATGLIDRILTGSLTGEAVQVHAEPIDPGLWRSFGVTPQLALYADVPTRASRPLPVPPRTRSGLRVVDRPLTSLHGRVLGPHGTPLSGLRVTAASSGATTHTDQRGRFSFTALPAGESTRLLLAGRGLEFVAEVVAGSTEPVTIHCDTEEE